jgi:hypothetical protein
MECPALQRQQSHQKNMKYQSDIMKYLPSSRFSCAKEHHIWHHSCCMLLRTAFGRNQQCLGSAYTAATTLLKD